MAQQIKKKFIEDGAIDGDKLRLLADQAIVQQTDSGDIDLIKLDDGRVFLAGEEAALKSQLDAETAARTAADLDLSARLDDLELLEPEEVFSAPTPSGFPITGESSKIYIAQDSNKIYHWKEVAGGGASFDHTVGANGDFATLEAALADPSVQDGDKIQVLNGTYEYSSMLVPPIAITKSVQIFGESKEGVLFKVSFEAYEPSALFEAAAPNVVIANMTMVDNRQSIQGATLVGIHADCNLTISNVYITHGSYGLVCYNAGNISVLSCEFATNESGMDSRAIEIGSLEEGDSFIAGCSFTGGYGIYDAIRINGGFDGANSLVIQDNTFAYVNNVVRIGMMEGRASFRLEVSNNTSNNEIDHFIAIDVDNNPFIDKELTMQVFGNSLTHQHGSGIVFLDENVMLGPDGSIEFQINNNALANPSVGTNYSVYTNVSGDTSANGGLALVSVSDSMLHPPLNPQPSLSGAVPDASPIPEAPEAGGGGTTAQYIELSEQLDTAALEAADLALQSNIDAEASARDAADTLIKQYKPSQVLYVSKNGSDTNVGSEQLPFLTIGAALAAITDASPTNRYALRISAGQYDEADISLKPNVFLVGESAKEAVRINAGFALDAAFTGSGDHRSGIANALVLKACDFDWSVVTSAAGKLYFNEVAFGSTVNMYGHNNAIAQAQFSSCLLYGKLSVSGINIPVFHNNICSGDVDLNQHPNGGMATIFNVVGGNIGGKLKAATTVNDFNRRCSVFLKSCFTETIEIDGPASYVDVTNDSLPKAGATTLNGGNLVRLNDEGLKKDLSNLSFPTAVNNPIMPANTNTTNSGDWGKQWMYNFAYTHGSSGSDLYVISTMSAYDSAGDDTGRTIYIQADSFGLKENVDGGDISLSTTSVSGTGVRGKISLDAREIDLTGKQIKNLADGTDATDAVTKQQLDIEKARIDEILNLSEADKDSFKEIVDLINSVDTENDTAFANYALSNTAALTQEVSDREAADAALSDRVYDLEQTKEVIEVDSLGAAPSLGLVGKIYVAKDSNKIYRWDQSSGSSLVFDKTVGPGETYETLEAAIAAAADGENILVKAGTYSVASTINVNKKVKIVGEDKDTVIFETAGATDDPTSMFNVSVDDVALAKLSIKHKKTSNSSIETAVVASGGEWPQTRIKNFLLEDCYVEFVETGVAVRAEGWCVRDCTLAYGTGSASNNARAITMYGTKGDSFIKSNVLKNDIIDTSLFRPLYLTVSTGTNPNETSEGKLVIEGMTQLGSLSQFFNQDNQQSAGPGTFELQIKNNTINETNLFAGFGSYLENAGDMFSSITLSGNSISNQHNSTGGKGLYGVYGGTGFRSSPLVVHADNNTLGQDAYRDGWEAVDGTLIGKEVGTPAFTVYKDDSIPASGDAPSISGGPSGQYIELSESFDPSELETELGSLDSRLDMLEAKSFAKNSLVVGSELAYIDLDREYDTMLSVSVGRLAVHEGEDYTVSVVGGVTRLTWIGSLVNPGGEEAIETGDKVFWSGSYSA